ncbi:hypothetical protein DFH07DRAFT_768878 [Mycena maculata]|uniref:Uncharacterized protein n=1 Tax=Mycena maculata TaxID=230809 RepID=A0AAD7JQ98_9AGAR|nr:hypothetical protein DFH07DRAFT_768878 [Mycena maculata]
MSPTQLCDGCIRRQEASVQAVANAVTEIDEAILDNLEKRLHPDIHWRLDEEINIPVCCEEDAWDSDSHPSSQDDTCFACSSFLAHIKSPLAGFSTVDSYLAYQLYLKNKEEEPETRMEYTEEKGVVFVPNEIATPLGPSPEENNAEIEELRRVFRLTSIRGRSTINRFMHEDANIARIFEGLVAALKLMKRAESEKRDSHKARLLMLKSELDQIKGEADKMELALEDLEEERWGRRRCPSRGRVPGDEPIHEEHAPPASLPSTSPVLLLPSTLYGTLVDPSLPELRKLLKDTKAPGYDQPAVLFARWLQINQGCRIWGVPIRPDGAVDLRNVRGRNTVMSRVPPGPSAAKGKAARARYSACILAVLRVLAIPGQYPRILREHSILVASNIDLSCRFAQEYTEPPTEEVVVRLFANQGLTVEAAADAYPFCRRLIQDYAAQSTLFDKEMLNNLLKLGDDTLEKIENRQEFLSREQDRLCPLKGLTQVRGTLTCDAAAVFLENGLG